MLLAPAFDERVGGSKSIVDDFLEKILGLRLDSLLESEITDADWMSNDVTCGGHSTNQINSCNMR